MNKRPHPLQDFAPGTGLRFTADYAGQFLHQVPRDWTNCREIGLDFNILETLRQAGKVEMKIMRLPGPANVTYGCRHFFRRAL